MSLLTSKAAMANAKAKASRLTGASNSQTPFYGADVFDGDKKTGKQPITPRKFKKGGKVVGKADGAANAPRADRPARKAGGRINKKSLSALTAPSTTKLAKSSASKAMSPTKSSENSLKAAALKKALTPKKEVKPAKAEIPKAGPSDAKGLQDIKDPKFDDQAITEATAPDDEEAEGEEMLKRGGRTKKKAGGRLKRGEGGELPSPEEAAESEERLGNSKVTDSKMPSAEEAASRSGKFQNFKKGGRAKRAFGGSLGGDHKKSSKGKGKTNINIVIAAPQGEQGASPAMSAPPPAGPPRSVPVPPPMPAGGAPGMPPAMMPPMGAAPGVGAPPPPPASPMGRKSGGRVNESYASLKAGSGSGLGRLHKIGVRSVAH